jgi:multiple antibiotic resistance protein
MHLTGVQANRLPRVHAWRPFWASSTSLLWLLPLAALIPDEAAAQVVNNPAIAAPDFGPRKIFFILFLMLGPIKILVPFVGMTAGADRTLRNRLATRSIIFSIAALALAGIFGRNIMANFEVSLPVLALAGGLVLFLVALQTVLQQTLGSGLVAPQFEGKPGMHLALNPLAFPTIVTPYGIAALIVFATLADGDRAAELMLAAIVLLILAMNWAAMIFAKQILKWFGTALQIFAVVLGITQVAIGLQVIVHSFRLLGFVAEQ